MSEVLHEHTISDRRGSGTYDCEHTLMSSQPCSTARVCLWRVEPCRRVGGRAGAEEGITQYPGSSHGNTHEKWRTGGCSCRSAVVWCLVRRTLPDRDVHARGVFISCPAGLAVPFRAQPLPTQILSDPVHAYGRGWAAARQSCSQ